MRGEKEAVLTEPGYQDTTLVIRQRSQQFDPAKYFAQERYQQKQMFTCLPSVLLRHLPGSQSVDLGHR